MRKGQKSALHPVEAQHDFGYARLKCHKDKYEPEAISSHTEKECGAERIWAQMFDNSVTDCESQHLIDLRLL